MMVQRIRRGNLKRLTKRFGAFDKQKNLRAACSAGIWLLGMGRSILLPERLELSDLNQTIVGITSALVLSTLGESALEGYELPWLKLLLPMVAVATVGWGGGWLNWKWARVLTDANSGVAHGFTLREKLAVTAAICTMASIAFVSVRQLLLPRVRVYPVADVTTIETLRLGATSQSKAV